MIQNLTNCFIYREDETMYVEAKEIIKIIQLRYKIFNSDLSFRYIPSSLL